MTRELNGNTIRWTYTGTASCDEIKMKRAGGQGGDAPISDGNIDGDTVSFSTTRERNVTPSSGPTPAPSPATRSK